MGNEDKIKALNTASGLNYLLLISGDIYLIDCNIKIEMPDFEQMPLHIRDTYEVIFRCITDREKYLNNSGDASFNKSIKVKEIQGMKAFGKIKF
jgi:hypothetical protein